MSNTSWIEWFWYWMSQTGDDWHTIAWAVDNNPLVIALIIGSGAVLSISFFVIAVLTAYGAKTQGFFSTGHKRVVIWFILFLTLCGVLFAAKIGLFFIPLFWVYGAIKLITASSMLGTVIMYIRYFKDIMNVPTRLEWDKVLRDKAEAERKITLLTDHLDIWTDEVNNHIEILKQQHDELATTLSDKGIPVSTIEDSEIHRTSDTNRQQALNSLEKIRRELKVLAENITDLEKM